MASTIRHASLTVPVSYMAEDVFRVNGTALELWRDGVLHSTYPVTFGPATPLGQATEAGTLTSLLFVQEIKMPGISVVLTDVVIGASGSVTAKFSDGTNSEYADWAALVESVEPLDTDGQMARDLLLLRTVARSPDGANKTNMVGGSVAINREADVPVVVTYPE